MGDFATHAKLCGSGRLLREKVAALEKENARLANEIRAAKAIMTRLKNKDKAGGGHTQSQIIEEKDIDLVKKQVRCSRAKAIEALYDNDYDLVNAIMSLTT